MSKLTREDVLKLAQLARLELSEAEIEEYRSELSDILQYVEHLQSVDIDGLEPTQQVTGLTNVTRDDTIVDCRADQEKQHPLSIFAPLPTHQGTSPALFRVLHAATPQGSEAPNPCKSALPTFLDRPSVALSSNPPDLPPPSTKPTSRLPTQAPSLSQPSLRGSRRSVPRSLVEKSANAHKECL